MTKINIAMCADWQYAMPLETTIKSIFYNNRNINIYLINPDIPQEWFRTINGYLQTFDSKLIDCKYDPETVKNQTVSLDQVDTTSSARLLIPDMLDVDRLLYLDSDLIVCGSLDKLYNFDLQGHLVGSVVDWGQPSEFNAGVMLMDLARIRQIPDITKQMLEFGAQPNLSTGDQTVYNHFFGGDNHLELPTIYNMQMAQEQKINAWLGLHKNETYEKRFAEIKERMKQQPNQVIVHYLGAAKPWKLISVCRQRELWWQFHDMDWNDIIDHQELPVSENTKRPQILVYTFTDQLIHLNEIIANFPEVTFNIATRGMFNDHFNILAKYPNVNLYSAVLPDTLDHLINNSAAALDIAPVVEANKGMPVLQKVLDNGGQVYTFWSIQAPSIADNPNYHIYQDDQLNQLEMDLFNQLILNQ